MRKGVLALVLAAQAAAAATPAEQLEQTKNAILRTHAHHQQVAQQAESAQRELARLQQALVRAAAEQQQVEAALSAAEDKLAILNREQAEKAAALEQHRLMLEQMIKAAIRLSRTPPQAVLLMPQEFSNTLTSARVLSSLTESIKRESESLNAQLRALAELQERVRASRDAIAAQQTELRARQKELSARLGERKALLAQLAGEEMSARQRLSELNKRAGSLKDLIVTLEKQRQEEAKAKASKRAEEHMRAPAAGQGKMRIPVAGKVVRRFGERISVNETSKGVSLAARENATVVAPFDGEVVFTGPFLDYGKMVILRHRGGLLTLLAGLERIDVGSGQFLLEGEPIGLMGSGAARTLYVELRQRNQPVNPQGWIAGLE